MEAYIDRVSQLAQDLERQKDTSSPSVAENPALAALAVAIDLIDSRTATRDAFHPYRGGSVILCTTSRPTTGLGASEAKTAMPVSSPSARSPTKLPSVNGYVPAADVVSEVTFGLRLLSISLSFPSVLSL